MSVAPLYDEFCVGAVIANKYRLEAPLGAGGQGSVWRARHLLMNAAVAIKVPVDDSLGRVHRHRLLQEAQAAGQLGHPGIVRVFDVGESRRGAPFLVMELLEGESLEERIDDSVRLDPQAALRILLPIADALIAAHAKGIVHRDLKPGNIFLARASHGVQPKLLDFGLAKLTSIPASSPRFTSSGIVVGSPAYIAPEQVVDSANVDRRADVWAFCVTLYECLSGGLPFDAPDVITLLRRIVEERPRSLLEQGAVDGRLSAIVERGMSKSPEARWSTMGELGRALAQWLLDRGVSTDSCGLSLEAKWLAGKRTRADVTRPNGTPGGALRLLAAVRTPSDTAETRPAPTVPDRAVSNSTEELAPTPTRRMARKPAASRRQSLWLAAAAGALGLVTVALGALGLEQALANRAHAPGSPLRAWAERVARAVPAAVAPAVAPSLAPEPAPADGLMSGAALASEPPSVALASEPPSVAQNVAPQRAVTSAARAVRPAQRAAAASSARADSDFIDPY